MLFSNRKCWVRCEVHARVRLKQKPQQSLLTWYYSATFRWIVKLYNYGLFRVNHECFCCVIQLQISSGWIWWYAVATSRLLLCCKTVSHWCKMLLAIKTIAHMLNIHICLHDVIGRISLSPPNSDRLPLSLVCEWRNIKQNIPSDSDISLICW